MPLFINIETSTELCSVSLSRDNTLIDCMETNDGYFHAERLHLFIQNILQKNQIDIKQISAVSVSSGPGSYTGLRIGVSAAKTFAYALNIPLIAISSLKTQIDYFLSFSEKGIYTFYCSTMKARGQKIYYALYDDIGNEIIHPQSFIVSEQSVKELSAKYNSVCFIGSGCEKILPFQKYFQKIEFAYNIFPSAKGMIYNAFEQHQKSSYVSTAYFEPMYI